MFHLKDGLCFEREADGSVRVYVTAGGFPPPHGDSAVMFTTQVPVDGFASMVASMSARGESAGTYLEVLALLRSTLQPLPVKGEVPS